MYGEAVRSTIFINRGSPLFTTPLKSQDDAPAQHSGVSDTTLMKLIKEKILAAEQIATYAPLEIKRTDLESEPVASILKHLKATGKLVLDGNPLATQQSLFAENQ